MKYSSGHNADALKLGTLDSTGSLPEATSVRFAVWPSFVQRTCDPIPVRAIHFDKSAETNWLVPWHQDLTVAAQARAELAGFGPWSGKDGIPHVQSPVECLQQMLTARLHLDDVDASNGALRVLPGTHALGRLSAERIQALQSERAETLCAVSAGDVMLMRPLLLHASNRSTIRRRRRVLHIEYAAFTLPAELDWHIHLP